MTAGMNGVLSDEQREYVLFHLEHHVFLSPEITTQFAFIQDHREIEMLSNRIVFVITADNFDLQKVIHIEDIPVLFPVLNRRDFFFFDRSGNLIFGHDILKSAFYFLSGYQEYINNSARDKLQRFDITHAVQYKLNVVNKPVVNYYFEQIARALELYCSKMNLKFVRRRLFANFGFLLSHDIDSVDLYTRNYVLYKIKEILGLARTRLSRRMNFKLLISGLFRFLRIIRNDNPHWNFDFLRKIERENNFRSIFFFLDTGVLHSDAYYTFGEKRMISLFKYLQEEGCEVGLHGTVESIKSQKKMHASLQKLQLASNAEITGIRQHRLLWEHPETALIQQAVGLKYDTTLGFAAHEGFRNSYCLPFRLFDFVNNRMTDIWEFPLNVMDVTLFAYRKLEYREALESCMSIINEVRSFGGIFTLLWHNSFFDENIYPGITDFYVNLLEKIAEQDPENILGAELLERLELFINETNQ